MSVFGKLLGFLALTAGIFFLAVVLLNPDTSFRDWVYCLPLRIENASAAQIRVCETSTPYIMERWNYSDYQRFEEAKRALDIEAAQRQRQGSHTWGQTIPRVFYELLQEIRHL